MEDELKPIALSSITNDAIASAFDGGLSEGGVLDPIEAALAGELPTRSKRSDLAL